MPNYEWSIMEDPAFIELFIEMLRISLLMWIIGIIGYLIYSRLKFKKKEELV